MLKNCFLKFTTILNEFCKKREFSFLVMSIISDMFSNQSLSVKSSSSALSVLKHIKFGLGNCKKRIP